MKAIIVNVKGIRYDIDDSDAFSYLVDHPELAKTPRYDDDENIEAARKALIEALPENLSLNINFDGDIYALLNNIDIAGYISDITGWCVVSYETAEIE